MDHIALYSEKELDIMISKIGGFEFKHYYTKNPKGFNSIRPGFRTNVISPDEAIKLAKNNLKTPYISDFVNSKISEFWNKISDSVSEKERSGANHFDALAEAVFDSGFSECVRLYLKTLDEEFTEEQIELIEKKSEYLKEAEADVKNKEVEMDELRTVVADLREELERTNRTFSNEISEKNDKITSLETSLKQADEKIKQLEYFPDSDEMYITDQDVLREYDDKSVLLPLETDKEYISLCFVLSHWNEKRIKRCVDIDPNGELRVFERNEASDPTFGNRDMLYRRNGPDEEGNFGVWEWDAVPNNNGTSDYIISDYNPDIIPVEVIVLRELNSVGELVKALNSGISCECRSRRLLFAVKTADAYEGILCDKKKDLQFKNDMISFSDSVFLIPAYKFFRSDIIDIEGSDISFFNKLYVGIPEKVCKTKKQAEIVRSAILDSVSWTNFKQRGTVKSDFTKFKSFLESISVEEVTDKICRLYKCNVSTARNMLQKFYDSVYECLDENYIDTDMIRSAILLSPLLTDKAKELVAEDWRKEHSDMLVNANKELDDLNTEISGKKDVLSRISSELEKVKREEARLSGLLSEKEEIAKSVENAVAERIKKARQNAADFIAEMAFVSGSSENGGNDTRAASYEVIHRDISAGESEVHKKWLDVVITVNIELLEAGVSAKYAYGLAAYLCGAFINKQPVLLAGPNAMDIVEAFSASLFRGKFGKLNLRGNFSQELINNIGRENEEIVAITNFNGEWCDRMSEIFSAKKNTMFFVVHPFEEDVLVEPKSLYTSVLPMFTSFFVDKPSTGGYVGGYFGEGFEKYEPPKTLGDFPKIIEKVPMPPITRNMIVKMVAVAHDLYNTLSSDDDFMFAVLPYLYACNDMTRLAEIVSGSDRKISITKELRGDLIDILGELQ